MSVKHSPAKESSTSAPDLTKITDFYGVGTSETVSTDNLTIRQDKRKRGDVIEDEIQSFMSEIKKMMSLNLVHQDRKFDALYSVVNEIKQQNTDIIKSIDFVSEKYEECSLKLQKAEEDRKKDQAYIQELEARVSYLERSSRYNSIEIRNLPQKPRETKEDLINLVKSIGTAINTDIQTNEIKDLFRFDTKSSSKKPIIVEFTTVLKKESILEATKDLRKRRKIDLNTALINLPGPPEPIYLSESLTASTKRIYALTRKFASENDYQYCWTKHGHVFIRKNTTAKVIKITKTEDLNNLSTRHHD